MPEQAAVSQPQAHLSSTQRVKKPTKSVRKPAALGKAAIEDWTKTLRQGFGAGLAVLGEFLLNASHGLSQEAPPKRRRK